MSNSQAVIKARQKRKMVLIDVMGGKCAICGYDKCPAALEFHHLNPKEKKYGLSSGNCHSLAEDLQEAKKCILVCANCHREIENNPEEFSNLSSSYDENKAQYYLEENAKQSTENYCIDCGVKISKQAKRCPACEAKHRTESKRALVTREELKDMIRTMPFTKIGEKYGMTDNAIRKWCDRFHLPRTKGEINSYSDAEWEQV